VTASNALSPVAQHHVQTVVDALVDEFGDVHSRQTIERVMGDSVTQLAGSAEVDDFLATLAHRFTRERLKAMARAHGPERALPDVLFIGLGDSGRPPSTGASPRDLRDCSNVWAGSPVPDRHRIGS
jgi:arsenate reductase (thioredoxin)